ncbi:MAG: hypothetical protein JRM77_09275 [Nitrososphaerota archaeon]|jgi:hypothetical protein|nr:hypothetical protein [Nitrososphaerota archaeon]
MSGVYDVSSTLTVLLAVILLFIALAKYFDDIVSAVGELGGWLYENAVGILGFFFIISFLVTVMAAAGLF